MAIVVGNENLTAGPHVSRKSSVQVIVMIILAFSAILFYSTGMAAEDQNPQDVVIREEKIERNDGANRRCFELCEARRKMRLDHFGGDVFNSNDLYHMALAANAKMISKMKVDYGPSHFSNIFEETDTAGKTRYRGVGSIPKKDGSSTDRLKRKIRMKILSAQTEIRKKDGNFEGCDCMNGDKPLVSGAAIGNAKELKETEQTYARYVWATGGHSAAAGHGNLYNETYTAFMTRAVTNVFASVGIEFESRNYAMGGTGSGSEISMCSEAVFGEDIDFLSWDYGMTDAGPDDEIRFLHYIYRAGLNPGRPAVVGIQMEKSRERIRILEYMEKIGLATFAVSGDDLSAMNHAVPDTLGMTRAQIDQMPELVRNFKCTDLMEKGEPFCAEQKYNEHVCPLRKGRAPWHPGVKMHALQGTYLALFLSNALLGVLQDLSSQSIVDPETMLTELKVEEDLLHADFVRADLPELAGKLNGGGREDPVRVPGLDTDLLFRGPNICKTGRTPSRTRYLGYLTETNKVGGLAPPGKETYDIGLSKMEADSSPANGKLRLVYDPGERDDCHVTVAPDYKDFFYANGKDGWVSMTLPNNAEKEAYRYDPSVSKGVIVLFFGTCDWGNCAEGDLRPADFETGKVEVEVNGKRVTSLPDIGNGGNILIGEDGLYWKQNTDGVYDIRARVNDPGGYFRLSTIVVY